MLIVRHAQSVWNSRGRWQGHADPPLSEAGISEARAAAVALGRVSGLVSSDLSRASQTAAIIGDTLGVGPVVVDAAWRERDIGEWQGLTVSEIERQYPGALASGDFPPGWESDESLLERVLVAIDRLTERWPSGDVLVVSHAGILHALERHFGCERRRVANLVGRQLRAAPGDLHLGERVALIDGERVLEPAAASERR